MISTWYKWGGRVLGKCERLGFPSWAVMCVAYLIGFEIAYYLANRGVKNPWDSFQ